MTIRKFYTFRVNDTTPDNHTGRVGEITYRDGFLYYHDGSTPGGEIIGGGGSGGGGPTSWSSITGKPSFATVATSGAYADLTGKPAIPSKVSDLTNDSGFITSVTWADVSGKPNLFSGAYADLTGKPNLFSGSYTDLTNKPTIPSLDGYATESWVNSQGFGSGGGASTGNFTFTNNNITTNNGTQNIVLSIQGNDATQPTPNLIDVSWTFDANGDLTLPNSLLFQHAYITSEYGEQIFAGNTNTDLHIRTLTNSTLNDWNFGTDGTLTVPGSITQNERLTLNSVGVESGYVAAVLADGNLGKVFLRTDDGTTTRTWEFDKDGNITLPNGGDIKDFAGNSVLGGSGGNPFDQSLNTTDVVTFDLLTVTDSAGIKNFNNERITNTYVDGKMYVGSNVTQTPVSILMGGAGPRNEWAFTPDGLLTFPRNQDQVTTTDPILTIKGGEIPMIASTDSSLMGPAELAIQVSNLNIGGYSGATFTINPDSGSIIADNDLVIQSNDAGATNTWAFKADGSFAINNNEVHIATNNWGIGAQPNATTVVYTAKQENLASIRVHATIEGNEDADVTGLHSQACDMMIVRRVAIGGATTVDSVVYGVIYTGAGPLATLDAQWNATTNRIEITATPTSTANNVYVKIYATEVARGD